MGWAKTTARRDEKHLSLELGAPYIKGLVIFYGIDFTPVYTLLEGGKIYKNIKQRFCNSEIKSERTS